MVYSASFRNWCFTSFDDLPPVLAAEHLPDGIRYICFQQEKCPGSGNLHFQGYLETTNKTTRKQIKKMLDDEKIHLEPRKGTQDQAIDYCKKLDSKIGKFFEYGTRSRQGNRTDLDSIFEFLESGATVSETLREFGGHAIRYVNHIERTANILWGRSEIDTHILDLRRTRLDYMAHTGLEMPEMRP